MKNVFESVNEVANKISAVSSKIGEIAKSVEQSRLELESSVDELSSMDGAVTKIVVLDSEDMLDVSLAANHVSLAIGYIRFKGATSENIENLDDAVEGLLSAAERFKENV